jgi:hypothetical protein
MVRKLLLSAIAIPLLVSSGCRGIMGPPHHEERDPPYVYIDEPIVLRTSRFISPVKTDQIGLEYEYLFDVTPLMKWIARDGGDFELVYLQPSSCSQNVEIYNFIASSWDTISFRAPDFYGCLMVIAEAGHLFSANGFEAGRYVGAANTMKVRGMVYEPKLRAVRLNPWYLQIPVPEIDEAHERTLIECGLAFDGEAFWASSYWLNEVYRISLGGEVLDSFSAPYEHPVSVTFDGENLWLGFPNLRIVSVDTDGNILCDFFLTDYSIYGDAMFITWADGKLWVAQEDIQTAGGCHFVRLDPEGSCTAGMGQLEGGFTSQRQNWITSMGWDGTHLWAVGDSLYEYSVEGDCLAAYGLRVAMPVYGPAWEGDTFYLMHSGPSALEAHERVISRFKIR